MEIYYLYDRNHTYTKEEEQFLAMLNVDNELKPIYIKECTKSRYLCKKERMKKLLNGLSRVAKKSKIIFFNFMHIGKSYEEISSLLLENSQLSFYYAYPENMEDFPFCNQATIEYHYKICKMNYYLFSEISKKYIKQQSIIYGLKCAKTKNKGRIKGATNKKSDYDPYKDKILEALKKNMSIRSILIYIGFGSKSGLAYYIKHRLQKNTY